jgi:EmrB/QacA subfamily drug resistance transporter
MTLSSRDPRAEPNDPSASPGAGEGESSHTEKSPTPAAARRAPADPPHKGEGSGEAVPSALSAAGHNATQAATLPAPLDVATVRGIIVGIMLAMFLSALEQTVVAPALATIGRTLGDAENLSWVVTAYLLAATAMTPLFGKLSDIYGRRTVMLAAVTIFTLGSVACALAPTMGALIAARALQGVGGGGILPLAQTIIADIMSPRERPRYQSYSAVMFMGASVSGPVIGGFLTEHLHWSLIFWINLPLGLAALVMTDRALKRLPRHDRPHQLDLLGATLMVSAALALMLAMSWGGTYFSWGSPHIVGLIAGSLLFWAAFALRLTTAREPFIPLSMLGDPVVRAITAGGFFSIGTIVGLSIVSPLYLELVLGLSASGAGTALIFFMAGTVMGSVITGRLIARLTHYLRVPLAGIALGVAALAALAADPAGYSLTSVAALFFLAGAGLGSMYPVTTVVIQNAVVPHQLGTATGTLNFFRSLGGAIIVAAFSAIVLGAVEGAGGLDALKGAGRADFAGIFRWVFACAMGFSLAAFVCVGLIEERPLRGPRP